MSACSMDSEQSRQVFILRIGTPPAGSDRGPQEPLSITLPVVPEFSMKILGALYPLPKTASDNQDQFPTKGRSGLCPREAESIPH